MWLLQMHAGHPSSQLCLLQSCGQPASVLSHPCLTSLFLHSCFPRTVHVRWYSHIMGGLGLLSKKHSAVKALVSILDCALGRPVAGLSFLVLSHLPARDVGAPFSHFIPGDAKTFEYWFKHIGNHLAPSKAIRPHHPIGRSHVMQRVGRIHATICLHLGLVPRSSLERLCCYYHTTCPT